MVIFMILTANEREWTRMTKPRIKKKRTSAPERRAWVKPNREDGGRLVGLSIRVYRCSSVVATARFDNRPADYGTRRLTIRNTFPIRVYSRSFAVNHFWTISGHDFIGD